VPQAPAAAACGDDHRQRGCMVGRVYPQHLKKAPNLIDADLSRPWIG
jgi:hypothetical protein